MRPKLQAILLLWALLCVVVPAGKGSGQIVRGTVIESGTKNPVMGGWVSLVDTTFAVVAGAESDADGSFVIRAPEPGEYYVLVEALGYHPAMDGILEMGEGGFISIEFSVRPKPIDLEEIRVTVERVVAFKKLSKTGFYDRRQTGFGYQLGPTELRERDPITYEDVFFGLPGVRLTAGANGGTAPLFTPGNACMPTVWVDGVRVNIDYGGLESVVDVYDLTAVEAYPHISSLPLQFDGPDSACGALLLWTK